MSRTVRRNENDNRYEITVDGEPAGYLEYRIEGDRFHADGTEVDPAFGGRGVGTTLVNEVLADVDQQGLKLVPWCPFVAKVVERKREQYLHLVPEDVRAEVGLANVEAADDAG